MEILHITKKFVPKTFNYIFFLCTGDVCRHDLYYYVYVIT